MDEISRVKRTKEQARLNYDRLNRWYDLVEGRWESRPRRLGLELLEIFPGERLLEIGCGTGKLLLELTEGINAFGLDLSPGMLNLTWARLKKAGKLFPLVNGDGESLPFSDGSFDRIFMAFTLELMDTPEIPLVLNEARRVLRKGGRLGIVSTSKLGGRGWMLCLYEWAHMLFPVTVDCRPIYARNALEAAGFSIFAFRLLRLTGLGVEVVVGIA